MKQRLIYIIGVLLLLLSPVRSEAQISYQYWIDNDTGGAVSGTTTDGASLSLNIDAAALTPGAHFCNIRARQGSKWGTVYRNLFFIPREADANSSLKNYEYWLDNDYEHCVMKAGTGSELTVTSVLDVSSLSPGIHFLNVRAQNVKGTWGTTQRSLFFIPREQNENASRLITGYRYGFGDDLTTVTLTSPVSEYTLVKVLDAPVPPLPMTIDDDCHFSFSGTIATLLRNVEMSFALTFTDEAKAMSSPVGTSFTVTDTRTSDILPLSVPGTLSIPAHATGGYTVMKFDIPSAGSYVIKSTTACSLRLYSSEGALLDAADADAMTAGYSRDYEADTYYAVAFGNAATTTLSITVTELPQPTLTYENDVVTISSSLAGATFYYTLDGSNPTTSSTLYESPIPVDRNLTVKAIASWTGIGVSPIATLELDLFTVARPEISHDGDVVIISTATEGASIYYTTDDTEPTAESTAYTEPFTVAENCTIKAFAVKDGCIDSEVTSLTVDWIVPDGVCGYAELDSETGTLTFKYGVMPEGENVYETENTSFTIATVNNKGNYAPWVSSDLKTVVFDPSYASARPTSTACWFYNAKNLTQIDGIENLNTVDVTDMSKMFSSCQSLTNLDVSGFKTENVTDMASMFYFCKSLTNLDVSGFKTENVTDMASMFSACSGLTGLDVSGFKTENVTKMSSMFNGCSSLTSLDVSKFNTSNVTTMYAMFENCKNLTSIDVTGFNTGNVTDMRNMFKDCWNLTSLDVSGFKTENVTGTGMIYMFYSCGSLKNLDVSKFNTENVTMMDYMFYNCKNLSSLDVSGFKTGNVTSMSNMFYGCSGLKGLDVSGFITANVTTMKNMFSGCSSLTSLDVSKFNTSEVRRMDGMFFYCSSLKSLNLSNFDTSNVTDMGNCNYYTEYTDETHYSLSSNSGNGMFQGCSALTSLDLSNFRTSNVTGMGKMFSGCSSLKSLDISNFDTQNVIDMREMFAMCYSLESLDVSKFNTSKVQNMTSMFYCCSKLQALNVSGFVTGNVIDMSFMFSGCSGLMSLDVSGFNTGQVKDMMGMFQYCTNVTSLDVSNFDTENVKKMGAMFSYCVNLTNLDVSQFNTGNVTDMNCMFQLCSKLSSINVSKFNTSNVTDMSRMFYLCYGVTSLNVRSFNTSKVTDMRFMFSECNSLKSLDLSSFDTNSVIAIDSLFSSGGGDHLLNWYRIALGYNYPTCSWTTQSCQLATIYVSDKWSTTSVMTSDNLFYGCTNLVGGMGTRFYTGNDGLSYARIDGGTSGPGYFTEKKLLLGDANGDGVVDQLDVDAIVHYIMGDDVTDFDSMAADANEDGEINVADVTTVINISRKNATTRSSGVRQMSADEDGSVVHYTVEAQCLNLDGVPADAEVNDHIAPVVKMVTVSE